VREKFCRSVRGALAGQDFSTPRRASCLHGPSATQCAIEYAVAAVCDGQVVEVALQHKLYKCAQADVVRWVEQAAKYMADKIGDNKFRVLLCVTGLSDPVREAINTHAADATHVLSSAIIVDTDVAWQFFHRLGIWTFVDAVKKQQERERSGI
jgi:hypothetical protein